MSSTSALESPAMASSEMRSLAARHRPRQLELAHLDLGEARPAAGAPSTRSPDGPQDLRGVRVGLAGAAVRRVLQRMSSSPGPSCW